MLLLKSQHVQEVMEIVDCLFHNGVTYIRLRLDVKVTGGLPVEIFVSMNAYVCVGIMHGCTVIT